MLMWLLLVSLFCKSMQDGNGQDNGVLHCEPTNLTLSTSDQMMLLTWEDNPLCSGVHSTLVYELVILRADKQVSEVEVAVTPDKIGSMHFWKWTSDLPWQCTSHSVRLRSRYNNQKSPWKLEQFAPGRRSTMIEVYPQDQAFVVGSRATFCCVLPAGEIFEKMSLTNYDDINTNTTKISSQTYAFTVYQNQPSQDSCNNVKCKTTTSENGSCAYFGYPPGDKDLQCETRDLESVECHWTVGRNIGWINSPTVYQLNGSPCGAEPERRCKQKVKDGESNWTLTAENKLGKVELTDFADVTKRVHMFTPKEVVVSTVNARNVSLEWKWTVQQYNNLNITCQANVSYGGTHHTSENFGVGLNFALLNDLIPYWAYNVTVRCGTTQHFWKWSDWSTSVSFHTKGDVPDALDVWMQMEDDQVTIIWKMLLANQSHGNIKEYIVTWAKTTETHRQNTATVPPSRHNLTLSLHPTEEYSATVLAININGSSSPSTITIPCRNTDRTVNASWITGSKGSFSLSWSASPKASCGYIVDWCPTSGNCSVEWIRLPPTKTNTRIFSKNFKDGLRYSLSIYACTHGAPVLLERREGYVREERINDGLFKTLNWKQQDLDVEISWGPISLTEQTALIEGYILYWSDDNNKVFSVSTADPEATSLTAKNLKISSYTFRVKAQTAVGECGTTVLTATLNSLTDDLIKMVSISLVLVFFFLSFFTIICYKHWTCIKRKVYPPIPKPVLTDKWWTSQGSHNCHPVYVDQYQKSEADVMDVPELHCNSAASVNGCDGQKSMPFVWEQTPKGYYNQPLKINTPPPVNLPTTAIRPQSGLPLSSFTGVFPNLSYNMIMQTGGQQSNSEPQVQEKKSLERSSSGYQPQSQIKPLTLKETEENPDNTMSCVLTYILLPQSPTK